MSAVAAEADIRAIERFLYDEAELLDRWDFAAWEALLTDDARYLIPPIGVANIDTVASETTLFVAADDREMISARVERMMGRSAFAELPRSNMRHMISNIRALADDGEELVVSSNVVIYRIRRAEITTYIGRYRHRLARADGGFRIREKRVMLDIDVLRGQGGISTIL